MKILVTGANGQLGREFRELAARFPDQEFVFYSKEELDISDNTAVENLFSTLQPSACFNCAAYTAVDKAEQEKDLAFAINANGAANLAASCFKFHARFIHISTDYVFDGSALQPYETDHPVDPLNVYGASKLKGEEEVMRLDPDAVIIRTSWVYSSYGNNFVKTMIRLMQSRRELNVVADQQGCPTYAADLAEAMMQVIEHIKWEPGIFHYSNSGITTWFDFASAINEHCGFDCTLSAIKTEQYPTPAARPKYSVLNTSKINECYQVQPRSWKTALNECLEKLQCK
jgi:dTDP-4-dehydrorhamnose reductase